MIGLLFSNWKLIGLGLAGLAVAAFIGVHLAHDRHVVRERDEARAALLQQTINYGQCLVNRVVLQSAINTQNASIATIAEQGRRASQEAATALSRAQALHRGDEARIAALRRPL